MKNRLLFLVLVVLFTIFGGGRGSQWVVVAEDRTDWRYEVDLRSAVNLEPEVLRFKVRASRGDAVVYDTWLLDAGRNTLTLESNQEPAQIKPGSVAAQTVRFFKVQGRLPVVVLPRFRYYAP